MIQSHAFIRSRLEAAVCSLIKSHAEGVSEKKRLKLKNHKNKFTFDLHNELSIESYWFLLSFPFSSFSLLQRRLINQNAVAKALPFAWKLRAKFQLQLANAFSIVQLCGGMDRNRIKLRQYFDWILDSIRCRRFSRALHCRVKLLSELPWDQDAESRRCRSHSWIIYIILPQLCSRRLGEVNKTLPNRLHRVNSAAEQLRSELNKREKRKKHTSEAK